MAIPVTVRKDRGDVRANAQLAVLAEELRRHRKRRDLSIEQLATLSGVSRSMISKIERCEAVPSATILSKLAEALGVTFSRLMSAPVDPEILVIPAARLVLKYFFLREGIRRKHGGAKAK